MKVRNLGIVIGIVLAAFSHSEAQEDLKQLQWMVGSWNQETQTNGFSVTENWKMVGPNRLEGENIRADRNGNVVSTEIMIIAKRGEDWIFEAKLPGNRVPVAFKIEKITDTSFTCRNNRNVFPKQIVYTKTENGMTADLSAAGRLTQVRFSKIEMVIDD